MGLYRFLTDLTAPLIALYLRLRRQRGREDAVRFAERLGHASLPRPKGRLVWCHAASVGEAMSVLSLIRAIRARHPNWSVLLTTGTVTSANLVKDRLPEGTIHQYVPVDRWPYVTRFLDHWRPDLALWVESELWPNMLAALKQRGIQAALLNGRMSEKSYRRWRLIANGARRMLDVFALGLAQTGVEANRYAALGMKNVSAIGNLKFAADPLPCDEAALAALKAEIGNRPFWLMASTHAGEEEIALHAHKKLALHFPDLLTIIAPRHPVRAQEILALAADAGLSVAQRSTKAPLTPQTALYLADTMGEMGLFYRLSKIVCLAGSFTWGGHNPIEPAQLGCAILFGPRMDNFLVMADDILSHQAARQLEGEDELPETVQALLQDAQSSERLGEKARLWAQAKTAVLDETLHLLDPLFQAAEHRA